VNDVGKPCAGEPHARFERGPLGRLTHVAGTAGLGPVRWKATTMVWSRPELQQWFAEPVAYLTFCHVSLGNYNHSNGSPWRSI